MSAGAAAGGRAGGERWRLLLEESGALTRGHFKLSSGLHSDAYVQCARLLEDPLRARRVGEALAAALVAVVAEEGGRSPSFETPPAAAPQDSSEGGAAPQDWSEGGAAPQGSSEGGAAPPDLPGAGGIDSVLAPAMGALLIGHEVAAAMGLPFRFTERDADGRMALRRGFHLRRGERIVIVEDVVTSGRSTRETAELARSLGAEVLAVGSILDRTGGGKGVFDVPYVALAALDLPTWTPGECPLCAEGRPVEKPGSRPDPG